MSNFLLFWTRNEEIKLQNVVTQISEGTVPWPDFSDFLCRESKKFENHWFTE